MTRCEQLKYCSKCRYHVYDYRDGIICKLTGYPAHFDTYCHDYVEDPFLIANAEIIDAMLDEDYQKAGQEKRLLNWILDSVFITSLSFGLILLFNTLIAKNLPELNAWFTDHKFLQFLSCYIITTIVYYSSLEYFTGHTIAKLFTKTKVVDKEGSKPCFAYTLVRAFCRLLPLEVFSNFGQTSPLWWHDRFSKTLVINETIEGQCA